MPGEMPPAGRVPGSRGTGGSDFPDSRGAPAVPGGSVPSAGDGRRGLGAGQLVGMEKEAFEWGGCPWLWHDQSWARSHGQGPAGGGWRRQEPNRDFPGWRDPPLSAAGRPRARPKASALFGSRGGQMPLPGDHGASMMLGGSWRHSPVPPSSREHRARREQSRQPPAQAAARPLPSSRAASADANGAITSRRRAGPAPGEGCSGRPLCGGDGGCRGGWGGHRCCRYAGHSNLISAKPRRAGTGPRLLALPVAAARDCFSPTFVMLAVRRSRACLSPLSRRQFAFI